MTRIMMITSAGRGIGWPTAILAAKAGYSVCINYTGDDGWALGRDADRQLASVSALEQHAQAGWGVLQAV